MTAARRDRGGNPGTRSALGDPGEFGGHVARALPAIVRVLLQTLAHDVVERRRTHTLNVRDRRRLRGDDGGDQAGAVLPFERLLARGHLIQQSAEGEDVGARIGRRAFELLGRHVLERSHDRPLLGQVLGHGFVEGLNRREPLDGPALADLGKTEVEELRPRLADHYVAGLEIAMNDAAAMRGVKGARDLGPVTKQVLEGKRSLHKPRGERFAFDHLQHDVVERLAVDRLLPDVMQGADVRMIQRRDALRLPLEARAELLIVRERWRQQLDRHVTIEARVLRAIDLAHAALANRPDDFIRPKACGWREPGGRFLSIHETSECEDRRQKRRSTD